MGDQAFLIATHYGSENVTKLYNNIEEATKYLGETYLLFHKKKDDIPD